MTTEQKLRKSRMNFTSDEDQFIVDNHLALLNSEIGLRLGRSDNTIHGRKKILLRNGRIEFIKNWSPPFREEEKIFLKENYWKLGARECARQLKRPTVYGVARRLGLICNPEMAFNRQDVSRFLQPTDPFVVYFLGFFWADGTIRKNKPRMTFKIKKVDFNDLLPHIHRLGDFWRYGEAVPLNPKWSTLSILSVTHRDLWAFLKNHDYLIKSGTSADKILSIIPDHLKHYWWRGYFDGDGSMSKIRGGVLSFNSGLNQDWSFVHSLGKVLDIDFTIERKDRGKRGGSKTLISSWAYLSRLMKYMYAGEEFGLSRKRQRCEVYLNSDRAKKLNMTSIYRGVSWDKRLKRFTCQISKDNKHYSKRFADEIEAAKEYDQMAVKLYGNKAILNFPNSVTV